MNNRVPRRMTLQHGVCLAMGLLSASVLTLISVGCQKAPIEPIRIAINTWPGYEFLYLAQEVGLFEEEDANIRLLEFSSLGDCRLAFDRGQADGMCCTLIELLVARTNQANDPKVVMVADYSDGPDVILGREEISDVPDLRGRKVGAEVGSLNIFLLARALTLSGMSLSDVEIVQYGQDSMAQAYVEGKLDAVVTYPPHSTVLEKDHDAKELFTSASIPGEILDVVCMNREIIEERFDEVVGLIRAWDKSLEYAKKHPKKAFQIMAEREGITPEEFKSALEGVKLMTSADQRELIEDEGKLLGVLSLVHEVLLETKQIREPIEIEGLVDSRPIFAVTGQ